MKTIKHLWIWYWKYSDNERNEPCLETLLHEIITVLLAVLTVLGLLIVVPWFSAL